jgi:GntR family transcriptional regulator
LCAHQIRISDLRITPLDTSSPIPLYYQVEADLRALLNSADVSVGDLLPTEQELTEAYGVGRHTVRTALGRLVNDNLIVRRAGHGTVVKGQEDQRQFSLARSFTHQMAAMGLSARSVILASETRLIQATDPRPLSSEKPGAAVLILDRLRLGNDEPLGLQRSFVVLERCAELENTDFATQSLYAVLANDYQLVITEIRHSVSAVSADQRQADLLRVQAGAPLLRVKTSAFLKGDEIIELTISYYRADKYEFTTTLTSP